VSPAAPKWARLAVISGLAFASAALAAVALDGLTGGALPAAVMAPALLLVAKGMVDRLARWGSAPLLPVATSAALVVAGAMLSLATWDALATQVTTLATERSFGALLWGPLGVLAVAVAPLSLLPACAGAVRLAAAALETPVRPGVARACAILAVAATVAVGSLSAQAAARAAGHDRIDAVVAALHAEGMPVWLSSAQHPPFRPPVVDVPPEVHRTTIGALIVVHDCDGHGMCRLGVVDAPGAEPAPELGPAVRDDAALLVMPAGPGALLVQATWRDTPGFFTRPTVEVSAFRRDGARWRPERFATASVTGRAGAPSPYLVCGLLGAALTGLLHLARRRLGEAEQRVRLDALIIATACLASAPLVAAAMVGLLG
jgi:hypothetical protein